MQSSILVVERDQAIQAALARSFGMQSDYLLVPAQTRAAAQAELSKPGYGLAAIVLDGGLADVDSGQFCAELRQQGCAVPVLLLDDGAEEADILAGLGVGATDYIVKPFRPDELAARLRAALRSHASSEHVALTIGHYVFRPAARTLQDPAKRKRIRLTDKETRLLRHLHDANGLSVDRGVLMTKCWGYVDGMITHTVESHVYRLRQKIEINPRSPRILMTAPGGYRLSKPSLV